MNKNVNCFFDQSQTLGGQVFMADSFEVKKSFQGIIIQALNILAFGVFQRLSTK